MARSILKLHAILVMQLAMYNAIACQTTKPRHSSSTFETQAECEAADEACELGCPPWMASLSVAGREVCMDFYELPPGKKLVPFTQLTWSEAEDRCRGFEKRLCTVDEWATACAGLEDAGSTTDCNCADDRSPGPPAAFPRCRSPSNVFQLPCNVDEWTATPGNTPGTHIAMIGLRDGKLACNAGRELDDRTVAQTLGTRCCSSPSWYVSKRSNPRASR